MYSLDINSSPINNLNIVHLWQNSISFKSIVFMETEVGQRSTKLLSSLSHFLSSFSSHRLSNYWFCLKLCDSLTLALPKTIPSIRCTKFEIMKIIINTYILSRPSRFTYLTKIYLGETGVSWHIFQKNAHKTQESLISGMSDTTGEKVDIYVTNSKYKNVQVQVQSNIYFLQ